MVYNFDLNAPMKETIRARKKRDANDKKKTSFGERLSGKKDAKRLKTWMRGGSQIGHIDEE